MYVPEMVCTFDLGVLGLAKVFGHLLTSDNYDDDDNKAMFQWDNSKSAWSLVSAGDWWPKWLWR